MLNTPGQDDEDDLLELDYEGLDGPDPHGPSAGVDAADLDDCIPLDDTREQVGYELFDWDADDLDDLDDHLHELGLPHEWVADGMELVIHADDERTVDELLPRVRYPDALPVEDDPGDDTDIEVLSLLFVAADRLRKDPTGDAVTAFLDAAERVGDAPYGVDPKLWEAVVAAVDDLIDAFHAAAPVEGIVEQAIRLRDGLRPLV